VAQGVKKKKKYVRVSYISRFHSDVSRKWLEKAGECFEFCPNNFLYDLRTGYL
jgi:hypothetical protein